MAKTGGESGEYPHLTQCDPPSPLNNPGYAPPPPPRSFIQFETNKVGAMFFKFPRNSVRFRLLQFCEPAPFTQFQLQRDCYWRRKVYRNTENETSSGEAGKLKRRQQDPMTHQEPTVPVVKSTHPSVSG